MTKYVRVTILFVLIFSAISAYGAEKQKTAESVKEAIKISGQVQRVSALTFTELSYQK
jgi:hypothetical protein